MVYFITSTCWDIASDSKEKRCLGSGTRQLGRGVNWVTPSTGPLRQVGHGVKWAMPSAGPRRQPGHHDVADGPLGSAR